MYILLNLSSTGSTGMAQPPLMAPNLDLSVLED